MILPSPVSRTPGSFLHPSPPPQKPQAYGPQAARPPGGQTGSARFDGSAAGPAARLPATLRPVPRPVPAAFPLQQLSHSPPKIPPHQPSQKFLQKFVQAPPRPTAPSLHRPARKSAQPQMLPNYPGNKSPVPPISCANQPPVCKTSVNKCCFLTLPMQKPPVFAVLVEGLFPPRPKNLPLPLSSPRRLWYNIL